MNYYELLDVPVNATTDEIKQHYRKYARIHHPDKGGDAEKFKQIQEAYETCRSNRRYQKLLWIRLRLSCRPRNRKKMGNEKKPSQPKIHHELAGNSKHRQLIIDLLL